MPKRNTSQVINYLKQIDSKLVNIESMMTTKDDLKIGLTKLERRLKRRFDKMDLILDRDLSEVKQRVAHIENHLPNLPRFEPITAN